MEVLRTRLCEWQPVGIDALALAPGPQEPRLAVGRANGAVELWDTSSLHLHSTSAGHAKRSVRGFVWLAGDDGDEPRRLLSAGLHKDITEWDLASLRPLASASSGGGAVWALCASGRRAYAACDDGTVRVFSLQGGPGTIDFVRRIHVGKLRLLSVTDFGPDCIFAGGSDSQITKWSMSQGTCEAKMRMEQAGDAQTLVWALVRLGEKTIASGDSMGLVQIWDPVSCTVLSRFASHQADVLTLATSPRGDVLVSGGIDAKISVFGCQPGETERWVALSWSHHHTHDVRAIVLEGQHSEIEGTPYFAGGVTGKLMAHEIVFSTLHARGARHKRWDVVHCSSFSPLLQTASVAQASRLFLCQRNEHLELWYLKRPPKAGAGGPLTPAMPESELVLRIALGGAEEGQHICASALAPDGTLFAASDASGSRLFRINLEELEVRGEQSLSSDVRGTAARAMLFCSASLLALATWSTHQIVVVGVPQLSALARFSEHQAAVALLASAGEWLASGDAAGAVHVFNTDSLEHHSRVPVGSDQGFPTALAFCAQRSQLLVALSSHNVLVFDVEARALSAAAPSLHVPERLVTRQERICGAVAPAAPGRRWLLWTHDALLALELRAPAAPTPPAAAAPAATEPAEAAEAAEAAASRKRPILGGGSAAGERRAVPLGMCRWHVYRGMKHILSLHALDAAQWGPPLHEDPLTLGDPDRDSAAGGDDDGRGAKRCKAGAGVRAMALTFEVSSEAVRKALPVPFERKAWINPK